MRNSISLNSERCLVAQLGTVAKYSTVHFLTTSRVVTLCITGQYIFKSIKLLSLIKQRIIEISKINKQDINVLIGLVVLTGEFC